jgi:hypothetical protein
MNKLILIPLFLTVSLMAKSQDYCDFIRNVQDYQDSVKLKHSGDYDVIDSETFDVNTYLSSFDLLEVEREYKIGVYFFDNFLDGNPYLYALKNDQKLKVTNKKALYKFLERTEVRAKNHIVPKDAEKGFLQYLFFCEMGEQFALKWHSNNNRKSILCSEEKRDQVVNELKNYNQTQTEDDEIEMPDFQVDLQELDKFAQIIPAVEVEMLNDFCEISWIEYRTHSGIFKCKYQIQRQSPFKIKKISEERLLEINMGFIY